MNYCNIKNCDIANGPGVRVSLFVSGCRNHCEGCFQPETWNFDYGDMFTSETMVQILRMLSKPYIRGLTILGGDPFEPENIDTVFSICEIVKNNYEDKDIWVYTGYNFEDFSHQIANSNIDVLVDGKFVESEKDLSLRFKGSRNQRIIDVRKSLEFGKVTEWHDAGYETMMKMKD